MNRLAILALFVIAAVAVVVLRGQPPSPSTVASRHVSATEPEAIEAPTPFPADSSFKFEVLRERALTPYRLRPDRRLVLAVAEIRRLAGARDSAVTVQFGAGGWTVLCGSQEVGKLSELPDFPEMLELATEWARKQAWARGWAENTGPERPDLVRALDRLDAPAALREADRAWAAGSRDAALFRDAAHAYALLALETPNWAGLADPITARSLATLAFARALGAEDPKREACMLAEVMGYSAAARAQARQLSAKDPLRLYVNGNGSELERVATAVVGAQQVSQPVSTKSKVPSKPVGSPKLRAGKAAAPAPASVSLEAPYLHLLRVAGRGDYQTWSALLSGFDRPGVPMALVFASGIRIQHPEAPLGVGEKVLRAMAPRSAGSKARSRKQVTGTQPMSLAQQIQRFEAVLDPQPQPKGGVLSGSEFMRAQRRSLAYAALDEIGKHSLETQGATEMSRWFALGSSKRAGKRAAAFQRWYAHLAKSRVGRPELAALRADVDSAAPGPAQALRSYEALRAHVSPDDPSLREAARDLVRRMDSRPEHRVELATIAEHDLGALSIAERLETSAAAVLGTSDPSRLAWRARLRNDADTSSSDARQPPDAPGAMATATDLPDSVVGSQLARRLAAHPTAWEAAERYAAWLQERGKFASARGVLERWVSRTQGDSGSVVTSIDARTRIAHLLQLEGHPERGLQLLGELHRSGHFGAMERTALILQDLGQTNQALAIAWAAHRRAPQFAPGRALLTELFWRQARYGEAAKVLQDGPRKLSGAAWTREIAPRYVAFFRTRESEGLQAAEALVRAGFDDRATFGAIPEALGAEGLNALAFELQSRMPLSGAQGVESSILAYGHLKRDKGEGAAIQWIRRRVAEKDRVLLGILAHQEQHPELLWSMAPSRLQGELGDYYWLLRAAACMVAGPSHPHYAETVGHVGRARGTYRLEIAKYLLGLREESEVLVLAQTLRQRSEIYYFVGLKTERRGRLRDAADWYLMSVESGAGNNIESRWAMQRLRLWTDEGRPRDRVAPAQPPPA